MKTIMKQLFLVAALLTVAVSAHAADVNKGSKSFQKNSKAASTVAKTETPENLADIAPAAGATDEAATMTKKEKSMREEIRLPRKN